MKEYNELIANLNLFLDSQSLAETSGILDEDLEFAIFGPQTRTLYRRLSIESILQRKKEVIKECKQEIFHDGHNIFRVIVQNTNDKNKYFPVIVKNGTVNELRYCFEKNEPVDIHLSLLSRGSENINAYYTEYKKREKYDGDYTITQTFEGQKIGSLYFTEDDEFDVFRITKGDNNTVIKMTFGTQPITFDEVARVFQQKSHGCITKDLQVNEHLFKYFLVPEVTSRIDNFRVMTTIQYDENPRFELSTHTSTRVKVYILCPIDCIVALWDQSGLQESRQSCKARANTCMLVGSTHELVYDNWNMETNEYHISLLGENYPLHFCCMVMSTLPPREDSRSNDMELETLVNLPKLLDTFKMLEYS